MPSSADQALLSPLEVALQQHLCVGAGLEVRPTRLQLIPELEMIVDLAVEDDPGTAGPGRHRLEAAVGEIQNGQPPVTQATRAGGADSALVGVPEKSGAESVRLGPAHDEALAVGPTVRLDVVHALQHAEVYRSAVQCHDACDAAHPAYSALQGSGRPREAGRSARALAPARTDR